MIIILIKVYIYTNSISKIVKNLLPSLYLFSLPAQAGRN